MLPGRIRTITLAVVMAAALPCLGAVADEERDRAVSLYDQQLYIEALPLLEQIRATGDADGAILYRLAFAQQSTGDRAAGAETLLQAEAALNKEMADRPRVESAFYLTNVYRQLQRIDDAVETARRATALVDDGKLTPDGGLGGFQIAELYSQLGNSESAAKWYARSLDRLVEEGANSAYVDRASGILGERAWNAGDWDKAAKYYGVATENGAETIGNYDRLAVSLARTGRYAEAARAWHGAELLNPAEGNRPRYLMRVANMAAQLGDQVPETSPSGTPWSQLGKDDLAQVMKDQAGVVAKAMEESQDEEKTPTLESVHALQARVDAAKPVFVTAALHYGMAGYGLRETAFFGGYAQLVFRARAWQVPIPWTRLNPVKRKTRPVVEEKADAD